MNKMFAIVYRIYLSIARQIRQAYVCSRIDFITPPKYWERSILIPIK